MIINKTTVNAFRASERRAFESEMVAHCRAFFPRLCGKASTAQLELAVGRAVKNARAHGFTRRGPVRLFIELTQIFGCAFDTDPIYGWATDILKSHEPSMQMLSASRLHHQAVEYLQSVSGPDDLSLRRALGRLGALVWCSPPAHGGSPFATMRAELARAYPEKAARLREGSLELLLQKALDEASARRMPGAPEQALFCLLFFTLGHGCVDDPMHPWIARALESDEAATGETRFESLRKSTATWFEHTVAAYHCKD